MAPELIGVSVPHGSSFCRFCLQKTVFSLFLAQPGVLCVLEPVMDCLTKIAVGHLLGYRYYLDLPGASGGLY